MPIAIIVPNLKKYCVHWSFFFLFLLQEYPLDDLCNEVIDRWKNSRAEVLQQREQVKGSALYVTIVIFFDQYSRGIQFSRASLNGALTQHKNKDIKTRQLSYKDNMYRRHYCLK